MTRRERQLWATAIHEAGHAIAAIAGMRRSVLYATIIPDGGTLGHVRYPSPRRSREGHRSVAVVLEHIVCSLAGYLAEREFNLRPALASWQQDRETAAEYALSITHDRTEANLWLRIGVTRARARLARWRPAIEAVAERLMRDGKIDGPTAKEVALAAMRERAPNSPSADG